MIKYANFVISSPGVAQCPQSNLPEYAFIGRSNVGKSSLINALCHNPKLAKTSQKPGKTLLINHFLIESQMSNDKCQMSNAHWHLVDLPGYGFAQAGKTQREKLRRMIERYCLLRQQLMNLFVLVDCRLEPQKIDLEFMQWLGENEIPFAIVFTKADKLGKDRLAMNIDSYKQTLLGNNPSFTEDIFTPWEELPPIFITSSEKNTGTDDLLAYIESINSAS